MTYIKITSNIYETINTSINIMIVIETISLQLIYGIQAKLNNVSIQSQGIIG